MERISINRKCVIFDFDGTLADTNRIHARAFQEVMQEKQIDGFCYDSYKGRKTIEVFRSFFAKKNVSCSEEEIVRLVAKKQELARTYMKLHLESYEGAMDFLLLLKKKHRVLVLATSSSRAGVSTALKKLGMDELFDYILTGDDVEKAKPHPEIYLKSLALAKVDAKEAVVLEDSKSGVLSSQQAGIDVIVVNNHELENEYYFTDFQDLIKEAEQL